MQPLYDTIGSTYSATRCADTEIARELARLVGVGDDRNFLDVACGTGNYTCALATLGGLWHGTDISKIMLEQATKRNAQVDWRIGGADALPYDDGFFDGAICTLAIHHFPELLRPFKEIARVLNHGRFVLFTAFPEQMQGYWLGHYFPRMMQSSIEQMPARELVVTSLKSAGFDVEEIIPFQITNQLQDLFLYSGKERPDLYFDPAIRANISSFASRCADEELHEGLHALKADIESGEFHKVAKRYQSSAGDYAYVVASKYHG